MFKKKINKKSKKNKTRTSKEKKTAKQINNAYHRNG